MAPTPYEPTPAVRVLRKVSVAMSAIGIIFVPICAPLGYTIIIPTLVPLFSSAILAFVLRRLENRKKRPTLRTVALLDAVNGLVYLGALMPIWAGKVRVTNLQWSSYGYYYAEGWLQMTMLVAYASTVSIINMMIHAFLGLKDVPRTISHLGNISWNRTCERCRDCPRCSEQEDRAPLSTAHRQVDNGPAYSLLGDRDDETPRPSEEVC